MARGGYEAVGNRKFDAETLIIPSAFGFLFGFVVVKGLVYLPSIVSKQLQWSNFILIKFYLAALAASLIGASIIEIAGTDARSRFQASRTTVSNGYASVALGGVLTGLGMALTGTEPGGAYLQVGTGVWSGLYVILGGVIAVLVYGYLHREIFSKIDDAARPKKNALDEALGTDYWHVALPLGIGIIGLIYCLETFWTKKWSEEMPVAADTNWLPSFAAKAWNIYYVGAFVGLLQIPLRTYPYVSCSSLQCLLDSTDSYISTVCVPLNMAAEKMNFSLPGWIKDHSNPSRMWSLFFFLAAALGGWLSAFLGGMMSYEHGYGVKWCLAGGFCLVLGALIAGNCPTGMAVSGCSDLNVMSFVGTACLFGSGVLLSTILSKQGVHTDDSGAFFLGFRH